MSAPIRNSSVYCLVKTFFETNNGEVTDMELCAHFSDADIHSLYTEKVIEPMAGNWRWIKDAAG